MFRAVMIATASFLFLELWVEVHGDPTIIGCYIRGLEGIEDGRCD